ncbi:MAG: metallophosphoesterase family protein [Promethearchaeota archaeon]
MINCFFVSDLHGNIDRYQKLFAKIEEELPNILFLGGDILPPVFYSPANNEYDDFFEDILLKGFLKLKKNLGSSYPKVFLILGNDDGAYFEDSIVRAEDLGVWRYIHNKNIELGEYNIYGYNYVPPTPFQLKDWEKYDVSRYVDPGCISPEEGKHSKKLEKNEIKYSTIQNDIEKLVQEKNLDKSIFLFHSPPYKTKLDRAALDGKKIDHVPLDVHVGSIAIKRFIENQQPLLTLHGHIHESAEITGAWNDRIGKTYSFSAAHNGSELALVKFNLESLDKSERELL